MCHKSHKNLSVGGRLTKPWQRLRDTSTPQWGSLSINEENMCQWWTFPREWQASYNFVQKNSWWCAGSQKKPESKKKGRKKTGRENVIQHCWPRRTVTPVRPLLWSRVELSGRHGYSYILCQANAAFQKRSIIPTITYTGGGVIALWKRKGYFLILICCT